MAGLVEKVKQSIRNRSRSRKSIGGSDYDGNGRSSIDESRSSHQYHDGRQSGHYQDGRASGQYQDDRVGRSTQAVTPTRHTSQAIGGQTNKPLPVDPTMSGHGTNDRDVDANPSQTGLVSRKPVSNMAGDSLQHGRHTSDLDGTTNMGRSGIDSRNASNSYGQQTGSNADRSLSERTDGMSLGSNTGRNQQSTGSVGVSDSIRQRNGSTQEHIPPVPAIGSSNRTDAGSMGHHSGSRTTNQASEHMRLPEGFNPNRTEKTEVTTTWRPAVTRETILRERTEILQEEITRDIHVHHYFTYTQPVRVVEVLPAKHFMLDHMTGVKTEIAAPAGWMLPEDMQARKVDTGAVTGYTRHYMVDEEHPHGIPEAPPREHLRADHEQSQATRGMEGSGHNGMFNKTSKPAGGRFAEEREFHHTAQSSGRAL